jgi:hypothetical protein
MERDGGGEPSRPGERLPRDKRDYNAPMTGAKPGVHPASRMAPGRRRAAIRN